MKRAEYKINLTINERAISKVIIDQHYQVKHQNEINDELIIQVLMQIDGDFFEPISHDSEFEYFKAEPVIYNDAPYRLIFLLYIHEDILGVINCFRVPRRKNET